MAKVQKSSNSEYVKLVYELRGYSSPVGLDFRLKYQPGI
jgi:hypothetical protein